MLSAIDQVSLNCTDLDAAEKFYCGVLGLRLAGDAPPSMKFFDCAGVNIIMTRAEKIAPSSIIYFKVDGVAGKIEEKVSALRAAGVTVNQDAHVIARNWHGTDVWLAFFKDPFGNQLALKSDVPTDPAGAPSKLQGAMPEIPTADIAAATAYYCDRLGFKVIFSCGGGYTIVSRDEVQLALTSKRPPYAGPISCYIFVKNIEPFYAAAKAAGANIPQPLETYPYGMRDFAVLDPDGNRVSFGESTEGDGQ